MLPFNPGTRQCMNTQQPLFTLVFPLRKTNAFRMLYTSLHMPCKCWNDFSSIEVTCSGLYPCRVASTYMGELNYSFFPSSMLKLRCLNTPLAVPQHVWDILGDEQFQRHCKRNRKMRLQQRKERKTCITEQSDDSRIWCKQHELINHDLRECPETRKFPQLLSSLVYCDGVHYPCDIYGINKKEHLHLLGCWSFIFSL